MGAVEGREGRKFKIQSTKVASAKVAFDTVRQIIEWPRNSEVDLRLRLGCPATEWETGPETKLAEKRLAASDGRGSQNGRERTEEWLGKRKRPEKSENRHSLAAQRIGPAVFKGRGKRETKLFVAKTWPVWLPAFCPQIPPIKFM